MPPQILVGSPVASFLGHLLSLSDGGSDLAHWSWAVWLLETDQLHALPSPTAFPLYWSPCTPSSHCRRDLVRKKEMGFAPKISLASS